MGMTERFLQQILGGIFKINFKIEVNVFGVSFCRQSDLRFCVHRLPYNVKQGDDESDGRKTFKSPKFTFFSPTRFKNDKT